MHSRSFLGVKVVRFGDRARRAVKVVTDGSRVAALLPDGNVAYSGRRFFSDANFAYPAGSEPLYPELAQFMKQLGVWGRTDVIETYLELCADRAKQRERKEAGWRIKDAADKLGVKLTKKQLAVAVRAERA